MMHVCVCVCVCVIACMRFSPCPTHFQGFIIVSIAMLPCIGLYLNAGTVLLSHFFIQLFLTRTNFHYFFSLSFVCVCVCVCVCATETIFLALGIDPKVAQLAGQYAVYCIGSLPGWQRRERERECVCVCEMFCSCCLFILLVFPFVILNPPLPPFCGRALLLLCPRKISADSGLV